MESIDAVREIIHPLVTELCLWLQTWSYEVLENLAPGFDHKPMIFGGSDWRPAWTSGPNTSRGETRVSNIYKDCASFYWYGGRCVDGFLFERISKQEIRYCVILISTVLSCLTRHCFHTYS